MAIREITRESLGKTKAGWRFDKKRELWVTWKVETNFGGKRHFQSGFLTKKEAENYLETVKTQSQLKKIGAVENIKYPLLSELIKKECDHFENRGVKFVFAYRVLLAFQNLFPKDTTLGDLRRKHFKDYVDKRLAEGVKPETASREMNFISAAVRRAADYFAELESWQPPRIYRPQVSDERRERIVSKDERDRLLNFLLDEKKENERDRNFKARRRTGLILYFGFLTGLRHGEICGLKKCNFDKTARRLKAERFKTKKTGIASTVFDPVTDSQMWVLTEAAELHPESEYIFSTEGKIHNKVYSILKKCCEKLGITYGRFTEGGFIVHDSRHSFITALEHAGTDTSTTRSFSGHSNDSMLKRYAHATPDSRLRAMEVIEREMTVGGETKESNLKGIYNAIIENGIDFEEFKIRLEKECGLFV